MNYEMMIDPFNFGDFKSMKAKQAQQYFDWFVAEIPYRMEVFQNAISKDYCDYRLDYSIESLLTLWKWIESKIQIVEFDNGTYQELLSKYPEWVKPFVDNKRIDSETLAIGIDVSTYYAEVIRKNNPSVHWGFITKPKSLDGVNQPVLLGFANNMDMNPRAIIHNLLRRSSRERNETRLLDNYSVWKDFI